MASIHFEGSFFSPRKHGRDGPPFHWVQTVRGRGDGGSLLGDGVDLRRLAEVPLQLYLPVQVLVTGIEVRGVAEGDRSVRPIKVP